MQFCSSGGSIGVRIYHVMLIKRPAPMQCTGRSPICCRYTHLREMPGEAPALRVWGDHVAGGPTGALLPFGVPSLR